MTDKVDKPALERAMQQATPEEGVDMLAGLSALDAFNLALEHPEPKEVVQLLPVESLYLMLHEIGTEDAMILLELASPEQVQGFVDIDCWERDRLVTPKARTWMLLLNELNDEAFLQNIKKIDLAWLVLFFRKHLEVHKIENPDDEVPQDGVTFLTPDGRHLILYTCTMEQSRLMNGLMMRIYRLDLSFFMYLLEAIYWEIDSDLEETAYQERFKRLENRGFPDYYSSLEILATVEVDRFAPPRKVVHSPQTPPPGTKVSSSQYLTLYEHPEGLLRQVLAEDFPERDEVVVEIMSLTNMAVVAARVSFLDLEKVRHLVARTDGWLNIGLQHLAGEEMAAARRSLTEYRAVDIHKIGRSVVVELAKRARRLLKRAAVDGKSADRLMLDGPEGELIEGLLKKELVRLAGGEAEMWNDIEQVRTAEKQLDHIERLVEVMHDHLGFTPETVCHLPLLRTNIHVAEELTFRVLFNTFRCQDLLGRKPAPTPLTRADLDALAAMLVRGAGDQVDFPPEAHENLRTWLQTIAGEELEPLWVVFERYTRALVAELAHADMPANLRHEVLTKVL